MSTPFQTVVSLCLPPHQLEQELVTMETIPLVLVQSCWCEASSVSRSNFSVATFACLI